MPRSLLTLLAATALAGSLTGCSALSRPDPISIAAEPLPSQNQPPPPAAAPAPQPGAAAGNAPAKGG